MNLDFLVDVELDRVDWSKIQEIAGAATEVPRSFRALLAAKNEEDVKRAYWKLENHVVVQGCLYEASIYLVPAICAALVDGSRPLVVRTWVIELLFQICNGYHTASIHRSANPSDIVERCKKSAMSALWILYGELAKQEIKTVESLIRVLEEDTRRLELLAKKIPDYKAPVWSVH